jgi:hypothetical protein
LDREKTLSRIRAVKVLNYALSGEEGRERCLRFVDVSGLKYLFPLFMGKVNRIYFRTQSIDHCLKKGNRKLKKSHSSAFNESEDEGKNTPSFICVPKHDYRAHYLYYFIFIKKLETRRRTENESDTEVH